MLISLPKHARPFYIWTFSLALSTLTNSTLAAESKSAATEQTLPDVEVSAATNDTEPASEKSKSYTVKSSASATRLNTTLRETPQSISVITRALMDDFKLTNINDVLDYATGIKVERLETDRTYYTARGSDITNFQIDGIGTPFTYGLVFGDIDVAAYDRIEILRGANGLLSGTGNPSATINFIRKRPTAEFQAKVDVSAGSWNNQRLDVDVSGPLNKAGNVRGRLVLAKQNSDSYLDRKSFERNVAYGIIEADISDTTTVALGHTWQQHDSSGNMWGSLPLLYADGSERNYKTSDSTAPNWSYWNTTTNITFAELSHYFNNEWKLKAQLTRKETLSDSQLLYIFGNENKATGTGLSAQGGQYQDRIYETIADAYFSGPFSLAGRNHELVIGSSWSRTSATEVEKTADFGVMALTSFDNAASMDLPTFNVSGNYANLNNKRLNSYLASKFNVSDSLKLTTGANMLSYTLEGTSYGAVQNAEANNKITPYVGAVYKLNPQHSLYASYTGIYNPQVLLDANLQPLAPIEGKNYETGIKSELFNNKLNTSLSLFNNMQKNVGQQTGNMGAVAIYQSIDANTKGYELDIAGEPVSGLNVNAGFTRLMSLRNDQDAHVRPYTPRQMAHLNAVYKLPQLEQLKVGASVYWQSEVYADITTSTGVTSRYTQDSYATLNLMANYAFDAHWSAALNLNNITNEKYLASLMWAGFGQSYYAAPRSGMLTLSWKY